MSEIITIADLDVVAQKILTKALENKKENRATIIALSGDLGAGKTTFVQHIACHLGISDNIQSPTFVILKSYQLSPFGEISRRETSFKLFTHIDAYRLTSKEELEKLNWNEYSNNPDNLICIEWPEQVEGLLPDDVICVKLEHVSENERAISFDK